MAITLAYFFTCSGEKMKAKIHEVYTHDTDVFLGKPRRFKKAKRLTWEIEAHNVDELIPAQGIELKQDSRMKKKSVAIFQKI